MSLVHSMITLFKVHLFHRRIIYINSANILHLAYSTFSFFPVSQYKMYLALMIMTMTDTGSDFFLDHNCEETLRNGHTKGFGEEINKYE